ncbi:MULTISPECIES: UDP-2,3-diacylglucosamine diphosphatase LpxI [unclassified Methylobacterium]|uniref:LpxI family protein n=1 Tax=unclassified Methylobacterium TaxID=2615210 RepID=UPI0011C1E482|nr:MULTISPECIES: UDP-2,3-diacylglucosamine diphosphatase LpxI [unclassified Methylobacterium]QEE40303.1 LpxI family protein [Methylobacterium sp. WL1]TXN54523.1 LpxI family protein [Methylobacterium sp. WL2]
MADAAPLPEGTLVLIAGAGRLPDLVAESLNRANRPFRLIALRGFTERSLRARADATVDLLDLAAILKLLRRWGPAVMVPAGGVSRPSPAALLNAGAALRNRETLRAIAGGGDDRLLRAALALVEEEGHRVLGVHEAAPDLLCPVGRLGRLGPDMDAGLSIRTARRVLDALSPYDLGQAVAVSGERVIAVEGPEGTDRMLARARALGRKPFGRGRALPATVLVKAPKLGQDLRIDLPAIGPRTVRNAAAAGCVGLALEAGGTLVIDRAATAAEADRLGLFLVGYGTAP